MVSIPQSLRFVTNVSQGYEGFDYTPSSDFLKKVFTSESMQN